MKYEQVWEAVDKLAKLDVVDVIWNEDNFVIWYN